MIVGREWPRWSAFVEHSLCMFVEGLKFKTRSAEDLRQHIDAAGVDETVLCFGVGQTGTITPFEGIAQGHQALHRTRLR